MKRILSLCFSALLLVACTSEEIPFNEDIHSSETGRIKLGIDNLSDVAMTYSTATTEENLIKKCYVIVFAGGTKEFADTVEVAKITNNGSASPILPQLYKNGDTYTPPVGSKIYVIANPYREPTAAELAALTDTEASFDAAFVGNKSTHGQYPDSPIYSIYGISDFFLRPPYTGGEKRPMAGIINSYSLAGLCPMTRTYAKVQVKLGNSVSDNTTNFNFTNVSYYLSNFNAPKHIFPSSAIEGWPVDMVESEIGTLLLQSSTPGTFYLEEYPTSVSNTWGYTVADSVFEYGRTCIIIAKNNGVDTTYYRLDFYDKATGKFLDIKRNHHYTFTINKINSEGYKSRSQAYYNPASNIEYTVTAQTNDNVIESNGQYAIAMTNNECHIFGGGGTYCIAQARYALPNEMTNVAAATNSITAVGTGLTLLTPTTLTTTQQRIYAKISETFTSGYLVLKLGNISDTIYVTRTDYDGTTPVSETLNGKAVSSKTAYKIGNNDIAYTNGTNTYTVNVPAGVRYVEEYIYTVDQNNGNKKIIVGQGITSIISAVMYWGTDTIGSTYRVLDAGINETTLPTSVKVFEIDTICNTETVYLKLPIGGHLASTSAGTVVTTGNDYNVNEIVKLNPISMVGGNSFRLVFSPAIRGAADANVYIYNDAACTNMISNIDVEWYARFGYVESSQPLAYMSVLQQPSAGWCTIANNQISVSKYNSFNVLNATNADGPIYARGCNALVKTTDGKKRVFVEQSGLAFISGTYLQAVPISGRDALGHTGSYKYSFTESGTKIVAKQGSNVGLELLSTNTEADYYGRWRNAGLSAQAYYRLRTDAYGGESYGYFVKETTHPDYNDAVLYKSGDICSYVTPRYKWRLANNAEICDLIYDVKTVKSNDGMNGLSLYVDNAHTAYYTILPYYEATNATNSPFSWHSGGTSPHRRWYGFTSDGGIRLVGSSDYQYNNGISPACNFYYGNYGYMKDNSLTEYAKTRAATPICVRE